MMTISLNNEPIQLQGGSSLQEFLNQHPPQGAYAVALNGEFVPRSRYGETPLSDGDEIDLVSPVGGG